ncbi:MAG: ABC transporter substrate-binding protein [Bacteroidetes bacterium]|jgi:NitT/TauT family transport system substrate-binding protein|nr:ABC transporter substrate-binding protein [Bacteroidota bacterium]
MKSNRFQLIILFLLFAGFSLSAQQKPLVFSTHWLPQAQFAGYYMAQEKGYYKDAGLDVIIKHPPANLNALNYLQDGSADIVSLFLITALDARLHDFDLVNIAQMSEHSAVVFVSFADGPVQTLKDFDNKKIGIWEGGFDESPKTMVKHHNLKVEWVPILSSVNLFLMKGIDLMTMMWYNEYNQLYLSGINPDELNTFSLSDYGFDIPEDGLYVKEATYQDRKVELQAFVEASLKGWQYANQNFDETIDIVLNKMRASKVSANEAHQRWMLSKILEFQGFSGNQEKKTQLMKVDFQKALEVLKENNNDLPATAKEITFETFYKPLLIE